MDAFKCKLDQRRRSCVLAKVINKDIIDINKMDKNATCYRPILVYVYETEI